MVTVVGYHVVLGLEGCDGADRDRFFPAVDMEKPLNVATGKLALSLSAELADQPHPAVKL